MWELTKSFRFEAAHALSGTTLGDASMEIHGHSFRAEVTIRGAPDPETGMVMDLGLLERSMAEVRKTLDHRLLNKVEALGQPTLENLSRFIWERVEHAGQARARQRASRQLQRELHLLRPAGVARHCEERSDEAIHVLSFCDTMDCFAALAMTEEMVGNFRMDLSVIEDRKTRARSWFEAAARRHLCGVRKTGRRRAGSALSGRRRPLRAHAVGPHRPHRQARRRRRDVGDARAAVREGRRALLDGAWRIRPRIPRADSRCRR